MLTPPRRPRIVTEPNLTSTPLQPKTSSVPLDGRVFKAATLDAELTTELENASIHEQAGLKGSYVVFWCEHSALKNLPRIKARNLKTEENTPLFLGTYWDPFLIPVALRQPDSKSTETDSSVTVTNSSGSKTRQTKSNTLTRSSTTQRQSRSRARQKQSAVRTTSESSKSKRRGSLRRELVTRTIPNTSVQETVEATVLPLVGSEEASVAAWLNKIIASFPALLDPSESRPEGWEGPRLTRSMAKETKTTHPLRVWTSQYAAKPVENQHLSVKPDVVFCGQLDPQTGFEWRNAISFLELTSSPYSAQLQRNIIRKAYAVFMSQPCRRFVVAISLAHQEFRLHLFDRSGAIHSLGHNLHKSADLFARLMYVFAFGSPATLGFDPTFVNSSLSPSILHRPRTDSALQISRLIYIGDDPYTVVQPIFISHLIRGRATSSWLVKRSRTSYVIKDYWTHTGRKVTEEHILGRISGMRGVPTLVKAWTVQIAGVDETTDLLRPTFLTRNMEFETRIHRRLLMTPVGEPLINFGSLQELVSILIDIVHGKHTALLLILNLTFSLLVHFTLVDVCCILHRDISLNNILLYVCPKRWPASSDVERKREDTIADKKLRRGLLIDFDYSSMLNTENQGVSSGHRTVSTFFILLNSVLNNT